MTEGLAASNISQPAVFAGHNRISSAALTTVTQAAAAESFGVQPDEIRVSFSDSAGRLAISLTTPVAISPLSSSLRNATELLPTATAHHSVWDRSIAAKKHVLDTVSALTGSDVAQVDIRVSGVRFTPAGLGRGRAE